MFISVELVNWVAKLHFIIITVVCVQPSFFNVPSGYDGSVHGPAANVSMASLN